jgi:RND superfamily putative drug exporter
MKQRGSAGPLSRAYAWAVLALHPLIPLAWVAAAVLATMNLPGLGEGATAALEDVVAEDSIALATQARSTELFGSPLVTDVSIVMRNPRGLQRGELESVLAGARAARERRLAPAIEGLIGVAPLVNASFGTLEWPERNTTAITYLGFDPELSLQRRRRAADAYVKQYLRPARGTRVGVTGASPARLAQFEAIEGALPVVTAASVLLVALIVGLHFRSIGAPLLTLAAAGVAYAVAVRVLGWAGQQMGLIVPSEVEPVLVVLLLGLVTDYAIFFLSGMRESLARGLPKREAMREATVGTARIVFTAGLIVAAGTGALVAGELQFFRAFGPGLALTALVSLAVCLTFIPAAMALFGRRLFGRLPEAPSEAPDPRTSEPLVARPSKRIPGRLRSRVAVMATAMRLTRDAARAENASRWRIVVARILASRPIALLLVVGTVAVLLFATQPAARLQLGLGFLSGLAAGDPVRDAAEDASAGFAGGVLSPTEIILEGDGIAQRRAEITRLQEALEARPGVAAVVGPREEVPALGLNATLAESGDAARVALVLVEEPDSAAAIDVLDDIESDFPALLEEAGLSRATETRFGGETKLASETVAAVVADLLRIALAALGANLLLLAIFMRALVAPLYLLAASVLAFAASLGITVWAVEQLGHGPSITYFVPLATAVLLVSLGSDYNVFVAGRIWDEARRRRLREAVAIAAPKAAGAITVAGVTLAATFALLALVPLRSFREFALLMVVGVLVDAIVVRSILIPGLISLFGEASWWPGRRVRPASYSEFVGSVARRAGVEPDRARRLSEAALTTLNSRVRRGEARALRQQLPKRLQATMDGSGSHDTFDAREFVRRVADHAQVDEVAAHAGSVAVVGALREVVDETTMAYVRAQLSEDYSSILSPTSPEPGRLRAV